MITSCRRGERRGERGERRGEERGGGERRAACAGTQAILRENNSSVTRFTPFSFLLSPLSFVVSGNMPKHIVCLTFDFDAISGFISREQTTPGWISRGEFGPRVGAPRLLALFRKYGIATSWYVPGHTIETFPDAVKAVVDAGHEIAHHGWTHRPPASLSREKEEEELVRGNEAIKRISGEYARGYRSPSWDLSPHSVELFLKHGFAYDSSMMGDDYTPYYARQGDVIELLQPAKFGKKTPLVEMPIHWSVDDSPHFEYVRTEQSLRQGLQNA